MTRRRCASAQPGASDSDLRTLAESWRASSGVPHAPYPAAASLAVPVLLAREPDLVTVDIRVGQVRSLAGTTCTHLHGVQNEQPKPRVQVGQ